jgi:hypothetical protein
VQLNFEFHSEIRVCIDCLLMLANGEATADRPTDEPEPLALWMGYGYDVVPGGEHAEDCPNRDSLTRDVDCDCDDKGFTQSSCEGCGSHLHGDRYAATVFAASDAYAIARHASVIGKIQEARGYRTVGMPALMGLFADAAGWRGYLTAVRAQRARDAAFWARREAVKATATGQ